MDVTIEWLRLVASRVLYIPRLNVAGCAHRFDRSVRGYEVILAESV